MLLSRRPMLSGISRAGVAIPSPMSGSLAARHLSAANRPSLNSSVSAVAAAALRARGRAAAGRRPTTIAMAQQKQDAGQQAEPLQLRGPEMLVLPTIFAKGPNGKMMKANVIVPPTCKLDGNKPYPEEGDQIRLEARGVVLFMHGFAQGPTAYARMLKKLAAECDVVVVAPCPESSTSRAVQQENMVDAALFWRGLIAKNQLPSLELLGDTADRVGLMGHSVGGGLAAYVADAACKSGQAFAAAHVMAPQTDKVVEAFRFDAKRAEALLTDAPTEWGVQYGYADFLSFFWTVDKFRGWLREREKLRSSVRYSLGTHVGFEDQLVVGRESFSTNFLPWVLAVLWGALALWAPLLGLRIMGSTGDGASRGAAPLLYQRKGVEGSFPASPGFGVPDDVDLPDERTMALGYLLLAATVTAVECALPGFAWDTLSDKGLCMVKGLFLLLAVGSWPSVVLYPYSAAVQRPEARRQVVAYFENVLLEAAAVERAPVVAKVLG